MIDVTVAVKAAVLDARLSIVGMVSSRQALEARVGELNLGALTRFTGFVSEEGKTAWLQRAAAVALTSAKEGWG